MTEFFDFILWMLESFVGFLMALPFMPEFTFGEVLIGIALMAVLISALVSSIRVANLDVEARNANANDRFEEAQSRAQARFDARFGKKG